VNLACIRIRMLVEVVEQCNASKEVDPDTHMRCNAHNRAQSIHREVWYQWKVTV